MSRKQVWVVILTSTLCSIVLSTAAYWVGVITTTKAPKTVTDWICIRAARTNGVPLEIWLHKKERR